MSAGWRNDGGSWSLLSPAGFPDEAALHRLVEEAPQLLPLSGMPDVVVVGREVPLGGGYADLLAMEPTGRLVVIEVKLARNAEARRAVVAQVLACAAFLHGVGLDELERDVLGADLRKNGHTSLRDALSAAAQKGSFDADAFEDTLADNLASGEFRLVLVLDEAPTELVRLVGYPEAVGGGLTIDLITVSAYDVDGSRILVPQRVDPGRPAARERKSSPRAGVSGYSVAGADEFVATIESAPAEYREELRRLGEWALALEREGLVTLTTYHGKGRLTLLPRFKDEGVGLVTIWNDRGAWLSLWRSVLSGERRTASPA